ncbi:MAG TPA: hypothetical protein VF331_15265 [Polyangiales bacterium]
MRSDRKAALLGADLPIDRALELEYRIGLDAIGTGEAFTGAADFAGGKSKHGKF